MTPTHCLVLVSLCVMWAGAPQAPQTRTTASPELEGTWKAVQAQRGGKAFPAEMVENVRFTFAGEKLTVEGLGGGDDSREEATVKLDKTQTPFHITYTTTGKRTVLGVYGFEGQKLTIALSLDDKTRPLALTSEPGSAALVITLQRSEPPTGPPSQRR